jgi:predicted nucleotidyltransferase
VHSLAGVGSTSRAHRALKGLATVGIVTAAAQPPSIIYRINREHALWPVIELAHSTRSRVFESIDRFCADEPPEQLGLTVVVSGSVARRESTPDSDVDLFVAYPNGVDPDGIDADARADFSYRISQHVERLTGNAAQLFSVNRSELAQRMSENDPLIVNVLTEGILVCASPLTSYSARRAS